MSAMNEAAKSTLLLLLQNIQTAVKAKQWEKVADALHYVKLGVEQMPVINGPEEGKQQRISTFCLNNIDWNTLKTIVSKFDNISAGSFYRSCKAARDFVDKIKPVWSFTGSDISYSESAQLSSGYNADYFRTVAVPEVTSIGRIGTLSLGLLDESYIQLLVAAGNYDTLSLLHGAPDVQSATFSAVKNLRVKIHRRNMEPYLKTDKVFQVARNRKTLTLVIKYNIKEMFYSFIKNWLNGESLGTLEEFTIKFVYWSLTTNVQNEIKNQLENHSQKTPEGYIIERGAEKLRIVLDFTASMIHTYVL